MIIYDYVRTNIGTIFKVDKDEIHALEENKKWNLKYGDNAYIEAIKSSSNIIDLIEVGDYVNGNKVLEKEDYLLWLFDNDKHDTLYINGEDIKSIVTKEQFEEIEYKVVEEQ